jgi:hypothetical protein
VISSLASVGETLVLVKRGRYKEKGGRRRTGREILAAGVRHVDLFEGWLVLLEKKNELF